MNLAKWLVVGLAWTACLCGCSQQTTSSPVRIMDFGLYEGTVEVRVPGQPGQEAEIVTVRVRNQPDQTTTVPAKPDTFFGFRLDPDTLPSNYHLRLEYEHPPFESKNGQTLEVDEFDVKAREEFDGEIIYCFLDTSPHEIVPGTWTFRVLMDGKLVAEKSFKVVK